MNRDDFNAAKVTKQCVAFIKDAVAGANADGVVIGLSGGLDSAVVATLCVKALGRNSVLGIPMPYNIASEPGSFERASRLADKLRIVTWPWDILPLVHTYRPCCANKIRKGNFMARIRMAILYDMAKASNCLVAGTENKSEYLMGYCTLHGDSASDFEPIRDLYKTEVRWLAEYLDVPEAIRNAAPSAELWEGQTDEKEMGVTYEQIDEYFHRTIEEQEPPNLLEADLGVDVVDRIKDRHADTYYKRTSPPVCIIDRGEVK